MQRLMQLINDFSRYQNRPVVKLTLGPCDVTDLLENARARFVEPANAQNIELLVEVQLDLLLPKATKCNWSVCSTTLGNALRHIADGGQIQTLAGSTAMASGNHQCRGQWRR